jgi:hypothetical protein
MNRDEPTIPDPANCVLCGLSGPGCPFHPRPS